MPPTAAVQEERLLAKPEPNNSGFAGHGFASAEEFRRWRLSVLKQIDPGPPKW